MPSRSSSRAAPKRTSIPSRSDLEGLAERRRRAGQLFDKGVIQADVARECNVSRETARRWYEVWEKGGTDALAQVGVRGRRARLSAKQLEKVEKQLLKGAVANGFDTDLWTTPRVALVIERVTGESYHPGHVWRILRKMGWTPQRPARRAIERDDVRIEEWVKNRWPKVKKTPGAGAPGSSSRTSRA